MIVCHLTSVHSHTDTRIFVKECRTLADSGFEVFLVAPNAPNEIVDGVHLVGIEKIEGSRFQRMTKTTDAVYQKALEIDADIYHFHDPELIPIGLKLKKKGKKVIYDVHEDVPRAILSKYWIQPMLRKLISKTFERFENYAAKKFDLLVTATPFINKRFKDMGINAVNINNFPLLSELQPLPNSTESKKQVCYVGGLSEIRGIKEVIQASNKTKCPVVFAGPVAGEALKTDLEHSSNTKYLGILNREEVRDCMAASFAGLVTFLPEPNHMNAQPNKMFEYMSARLPVIASYFPLWKEIIEGNQCGICVNPNNPQEIADAINTLVLNPELAIELGENGRNAVEEKYNWEIEGQQLMDVYSKLR